MCGRVSCALNATELKQAILQTYFQQTQKQQGHNANTTAQNQQQANNNNNSSSPSSQQQQTLAFVDEDRFTPSYNIAPNSTYLPCLKLKSLFSDSSFTPSQDSTSSQQLTLSQQQQQELPYTLHGMSWGLMSSQLNLASDDEAFEWATKLTNARAETIFEKKTFKSLLSQQKRCVVFIDGFFEWKNLYNNNSSQHQQHQPFYVKHAQFPLLAVAALYDSYTLASNGQTLHTFTIITTAATQINAEHVDNEYSRVPIVLQSRAQIETWLNSNDYAVLQQLLRTPPRGVLQSYRVSPMVSNLKFNDAKCIARYDLHEQQKAAKIMPPSPPTKQPVTLHFPAAAASSSQQQSQQQSQQSPRKPLTLVPVPPPPKRKVPSEAGIQQLSPQKRQSKLSLTVSRGSISTKQQPLLAETTTCGNSQPNCDSICNNAKKRGRDEHSQLNVANEALVQESSQEVAKAHRVI